MPSTDIIVTEKLLEDIMNETLYRFYGFLCLHIDELVISAGIDPHDDDVCMQIDKAVFERLGNAIEDTVISKLAGVVFTVSGPSYREE
jgi:hypothetical protein